MAFPSCIWGWLQPEKGQYQCSWSGHCHYCCCWLSWCSVSHGKGVWAQSRGCFPQGVQSISPSESTDPRVSTPQWDLPHVPSLRAAKEAEQPWTHVVVLGTLKYPTLVCSSLASACRAVTPPHICPVHMVTWPWKPLRALVLEVLAQGCEKQTLKPGSSPKNESQRHELCILPVALISASLWDFLKHTSVRMQWIVITYSQTLSQNISEFPRVLRSSTTLLQPLCAP